MESIVDSASFKKVIFWQRVVAFMLLVSIVGVVLFFFYFFLDSYEYRKFFEGRSQDLYAGVVIGITCLIGLGLTLYLNWTLFRASRCLQYYIASEEMKDLEKSVKYQTTFWKLFTLSPFIAIALFLLMVVILIFMSENMRVREPIPMIDETGIQVG
jgi:hypothetical protein